MSAGACIRVAGSSSATWAGSSIEIDYAGAETWEYDAELGLDAASVVDVADSVVAWANDAGRSWSGDLVLSWSVSESTDGGWLVTFTGTDSAAWTSSADFAALMGVPASPPGSSSSLVGTSRAVATCHGPVALTGHVRQPGDGGMLSASGAWLLESQRASLTRPDCSMALDEAEQHALADALELAASPREAHIWDTVSDDWILCSLGRVSVSREAQFYRVSAEVTY